MKKITLLLMVFALAWSGQLKAVTLPETSKDGKVKCLSSTYKCNFLGADNKQ